LADAAKLALDATNGTFVSPRYALLTVRKDTFTPLTQAL
jgi:hypothetical protein